MSDTTDPTKAEAGKEIYRAATEAIVIRSFVTLILTFPVAAIVWGAYGALQHSWIAELPDMGYPAALGLTVLATLCMFATRWVAAGTRSN